MFIIHSRSDKIALAMAVIKIHKLLLFSFGAGRSGSEKLTSDQTRNASQSTFEPLFHTPQTALCLLQKCAQVMLKLNFKLLKIEKFWA
jgi:hypothetical protein